MDLKDRRCFMQHRERGVKFRAPDGKTGGTVDSEKRLVDLPQMRGKQSLADLPRHKGKENPSLLQAMPERIHRKH